MSRKGLLKDILSVAGSDDAKMVEFTMAEGCYAIGVAKVREVIRSVGDILPLPDAHESVAGVINLRGIIIPVIDLARHLKQRKGDAPAGNRIIITECGPNGSGFLVDTVTRIHTLPWDDLKSARVAKSTHEYTAAAVRVDSRVLFVLDFDRIAADVLT